MARGMRRPKGMHPKTHAGLMKYGKGKKTKNIAKDLQGKVRDPKALAVWIRRQALGKAEFKRHQVSARRKKTKRTS